MNCPKCQKPLTLTVMTEVYMGEPVALKEKLICVPCGVVISVEKKEEERP